jgi:hypothetical protein
MSLRVGLIGGNYAEGFLSTLTLTVPSGDRVQLFEEDEDAGPFLIGTPATLSYILETPRDVAAARRMSFAFTRWSEARDAGFVCGTLTGLAMLALIWILIWHWVGSRKLPPIGPS